MISGFKIVTETPSWFILLCIIFAAAIATLLYFRSGDKSLSGKTRIVLGLLRFFAITIIAFLLLNPLIRRFVREKEPPVIVVAMDNSESMLIHSEDTIIDATILRNSFKTLVDELSRDHEIETFSFGETVNDTKDFDFKDKETDMSDLFKTLEARYAGRNTGAYIITSDGIFNKGHNPLTFASRINHPVYTVKWGDTTVKRDLILAEVNHNRIAYLGNDFPVEVIVRATRSKGLTTTLTVRTREKVLVSQSIEITSDNFSTIIPLSLKAEKEGIMDIEVSLAPLENEVTLANNQTRIFVEVLSSKKKILLLSRKPHPDLGAIYSGLLSNDALEAEIMMLSDMEGDLAGYDLVILHQLPDNNATADIVNKLIDQKVPVMVVGGGATRTEVLAAEGIAPVHHPGRLRGQHNEVLASVNSGFALFNPEEEFVEQLNELPPLQALFGRYESLPGEQILFYQRVGRVTTSYPLISFYQIPGYRAGFIAGEGIWRWRMYSYRNNLSHRPFDRLINQFVQYLTAIEDRTRFRVSTDSYFPENSNIIFSAELYDAAFNPVVEPEVSLDITGSDDKRFSYTFSRKGSFYTLDAGRLPVDEYRYTARTTLGNEDFSATGRFVIAPLNLESIVTRADHNLLRELSFNTGGLAVNIDEIDKIVNDIYQRDDVRPISHLREKYTDITTILWLLGVILLLLATEWFIKKWLGTY